MIPNLIVPVLNRYDLLRRMIQSIDYPIEHLLIIDNGGEFHDVLHTEFIDNIHVLNLPSNLGVAGSWNLGVKLFPHHNRWTITSNDVMFQPGNLARIAEARSDRLTLMAAPPHWHTFVIGDEVVKKVGLASERFYPAYFEDNDWQRRIEHAGFTIDRIEVPIHHDNSSTLHANPKFGERNSRTYMMNMNFYQGKTAAEDYTESPWDLGIRRWNEWLTDR